MSAKLDRVCVVVYGPGEVKCLAHAIGYCDAPTLLLEDETGAQFHWREDLCREAGPFEQIAYWKARALKADGAAKAS